MTDVQDMTEEEYRLYKLRRFAAGLLRRNGLDLFAEQAECVELDDCPEMRVAAFFVDPLQPHGDEYIADWDDAAARVHSLRGL